MDAQNHSLHYIASLRSSLLTEAYSETATLGSAARSSICTGIVSLQKDIVSHEKYTPRTLFQLHYIEQDVNATDTVNIKKDPDGEKITEKESARINRSERARRSAMMGTGSYVLQGKGRIADKELT
jgi:tetrahydrodipicolinate N-succinyltransferase